MYRPKGLNVDIYLRKSRKDIEEEKRLLETTIGDVDTLRKHRNQLMAVLKAEGHNLLQIHEELVSGEFISERPKIQEVIRRVEAGLLDAILVIDLDRLGRGDMLDQGLLDRAFRYSGTKILTPVDYYDPEDESWELVFGIKSLVARQELKAITRRLQTGRRESALEGKSISKKPPFGYLRDNDLKLYPDPENDWVVKKIFTMLKDGFGRQHIARELDKLGVKPPNKKNFWSPSSITAIVKNEAYMGHIIWGKYRYKKQQGGYQRIKVDKKDWIVSENAHEPLVSEELWEAANKAHSGRHRPSTVESKTLSNPLAGVMKCELCGYTLQYQPRKDRPNPAIRCVQPSCRGQQKGSSLPLVEERVLEGLERYISELQLTTFQKDITVSSMIPEKEILLKNKTKELQELEKQKNNLHDLLEQGVYTIEVFMTRQKNITERMERLQDECSQIQNLILQEKLQEKHMHEFVPKVEKVISAYRSTTDIVKKNKLLKSILEKATYLRKPGWDKQGQFKVQLYPKI
ncbi:recombinase family protein [Sutcliffiella horikoshii]|uniref:Recombinase family protein n=1 Tax=Sutcliffiella horikoshii TaxID=79883 RepID=A0A5D4SA86_9BACI|nr:recombinase family protein [Sutcliffiella horikoshii]TYS60523.1 recombinase family protein [Sutcliffiella horikoshii]